MTLLVKELEDAVKSNGTIKGLPLSVLVKDNILVLKGMTKTYFQKQIVIHCVQNFIARQKNVQVLMDIEVA